MPDYTNGYAIVFTMFLNGSYEQSIIESNVVAPNVGTNEVSNIRDMMFSNSSALRPPARTISETGEGSGKIYGWTAFEVWRAGGFVPAQEPVFEVVTHDYVFPGQ